MNTIVKKISAFANLTGAGMVLGAGIGTTMPIMFGEGIDKVKDCGMRGIIAGTVLGATSAAWVIIMSHIDTI
jgi:hypothetical protein